MEHQLGLKIRELRQKRKLTMRQLAKMVGVNYTTIHRVETGKVSPSVVLLSDIAHILGSSIANLLEDKGAKLTLIRSEDQPQVDSGKMRLRLLIPQGLIDESISISLGNAQPGECIDKHQTNGFELAYIIRGRCVFKHGGRDYELKEGDVVYFDGREWHSVICIEPLEFIALYFRR